MVGFTLLTTILLSFLSISFQSAPKCGQSTHCNRGFVIEGAPTCAREFPFFAALVRPSRSQRQLKPFCGASIITAKFLLSAAHCFKYSPGDPLKTANQVRVYPGYDDRSVEQPLYYFVKRIEVHEDWLENTGKWSRGTDIALLEVKEAMQFSETISPICIPNPEDSYLIEEGRGVQMAGFGSTKHFQNVIPQQLQKGDFQMINCTAKSPNNICADQVENGRVVSSTCRGDSGGGLVGLANGHFHLVGVVSWGRRCGDTDFTTRYVNIFNHLPWINNRICLTENGNLCILPYQFELTEYTQCEPSDTKSKATCPTTVDRKGEGYGWEPCSKQCPGFKQSVNGGFGAWSDWTDCSKGGIRSRERDCANPVAQYGGVECQEDLFEEKESCNVGDSVEDSVEEDTSAGLDPDDGLQCRAVGEQCFNVEWLRSQEKCLNLVKAYDDVNLEAIRSKTCRVEPYGVCCASDAPVTQSSKNGGWNEVYSGSWSCGSSIIKWEQPEAGNLLRSNMEENQENFIAPVSGLYQINIFGARAASSGSYERIFLVSSMPSKGLNPIETKDEKQTYELLLEKGDSIAVWIMVHSTSGNATSLRMSIKWG